MGGCIDPSGADSTGTLERKPLGRLLYSQPFEEALPAADEVELVEGAVVRGRRAGVSLRSGAACGKLVCTARLSRRFRWTWASESASAGSVGGVRLGSGRRPTGNGRSGECIPGGVQEYGQAPESSLRLSFKERWTTGRPAPSASPTSPPWERGGGETA